MNHPSAYEPTPGSVDLSRIGRAIQRHYPEVWQGYVRWQYLQNYTGTGFYTYNTNLSGMANTQLQAQSNILWQSGFATTTGTILIASPQPTQSNATVTRTQTKPWWKPWQR